jgi:hypothetical protein
VTLASYGAKSYIHGKVTNYAWDISLTLSICYFLRIDPGPPNSPINTVTQ